MSNSQRNKYREKDQAKIDLSDCFIGRGSSKSSTNEYAQKYAQLGLANKGHYSSASRVFISAEGNRKGRLDPDFDEIERAIKAGALLITDDSENRQRAYNIGERQVCEFLKGNGYKEFQPGKWLPAGQRHHFGWSRFGGYEVSSKGDKRFSAFFCYLQDHRSIEQHYQCDVKGYDKGGVNWKLGKGRPALVTETPLWEEYLKLWKTWSQDNLPLMRELFANVRAKSNYGCTGLLTDRFATTEINQAHALAVILNELCRK